MISSLTTAVNQRSIAPMETTKLPMLQGLLGRHSLGIKHLAEPGPDETQLLTMTQAALRAPDHAGLVPFRFKVVRGTQRDALAELFAQYISNTLNRGTRMEQALCFAIMLQKKFNRRCRQCYALKDLVTIRKLCRFGF